MSGIFGAKVQYVRFDQLIFSGDSAAVSVASNASEPPARSYDAGDPRGKASFQPEGAPGGKIKCWKCGKTNWPTQDKCWDCYTTLYEKE